MLLQNTLKTTYWEFPKGKIEAGEQINQTVKREAQEETGLKNFQIIRGFKREVQWYFQFEGKTIRKNAIYLLIKIPAGEKNKKGDDDNDCNRYGNVEL